jgi:hypothetical protein
LEISSAAIGGPDATSFRVAWDGCSGLAIDPAYSCPVAVGFNPRAGHPLNASLLVNDDATGSPHAVPLSGAGEAPGVSLSATKIDFGSVELDNQSAPATVTLTNSGNRPLLIASVTLSGSSADDYSITTDNCGGQELAPGAACTVTMVFRPLAVGTRTATLTFTDNAPDSPQIVALTGTGFIT